MKISRLLISSIIAIGITPSASYADKLKVNITKTLPSIEVMHKGKKITIQRNQNTKNKVSRHYEKTSRPCPPFCINPIKLAPGVDTLGELEVLDYLQKMSAGDQSILVIDSRTPDWIEVKSGTIPGAVNIPHTKLTSSKSDPITIAEILTEQFGATENDDDSFSFTNAKTLVMFCNGMWCGQSPNNIRSLLKMGYPAQKLKWYRGGMQNWENLGLTTTKK